MPQLTYVQNQLQGKIAFFKRKRNYNRAMSLLFVCAASVLSGLATVSLGASKMLIRPWLEVVALVSTGLATVTGAIAALISHRKLWHINNVAMAALDKLKWDIEFRLANDKPILESETADFYARLTGILEDADNSWIDTYAVK